MSHATLDSSSNKPLAVEQDSLSGKSGNRQRGWLNWLLGSVPTLLVLALLAGLGYFGHRSHWKMPKFATLAGIEAERRTDWCEEHGVSESQCVLCKPELMPAEPDYGWCIEHGVSNCSLHHPDVAQLQEIPTIAMEDLERAARALTLDDRKPNNAVCDVGRKLVQFASAEAARQAGVDVEIIDRQPINESVSGNGEITYDQTRLAHLTSRLPGNVWRVEKNVGDPVQAGELLALIDAVEVGQAKSRLMQALAEAKLQQQNVVRLESAGSAVAGRQLLEANAAFAKARAVVISAEQSLINLGLPVDADPLLALSEREVMGELRLLGVPATLRDQLNARTITANLLPVLSPMTGMIVAREAVVGEVVDANDSLFQVADTTRMWLTLNVALEDVGKLQVGQSVQFRPAGNQKEIEGTLAWISTGADPETRMVKVRAELPNPEAQLRDETFGTGRIVLREEPDAIAIPNSAVHWEGCCQIAFVRDRDYFKSPESPKVFHIRVVRLGVQQGSFSEVIAGVLPGEIVATAGSDVLRAQLLKNNLGAGCCAAD